MSCLALLLILLLPLPIRAQTTEATVSSQAHAKYDAGDLDQAKTLFTEFLERFPSSSLAPDAQYFLGWIAHKKNTGDAEKVWRTVVDKYPQSPEAPKALMSIGALHYKAKMDRAARMAEWQNVVTRYPSSPEAEEARFYVGSLSKGRPANFEKALSEFQ